MDLAVVLTWWSRLLVGLACLTAKGDSCDSWWFDRLTLREILLLQLLINRSVVLLGEAYGSFLFREVDSSYSSSIKSIGAALVDLSGHGLIREVPRSSR